MNANSVYNDIVTELSSMNVLELFNVAESEFLLQNFDHMSDLEIIHTCALIESNNFCS